MSSPESFGGLMLILSIRMFSLLSSYLVQPLSTLLYFPWTRVTQSSANQKGSTRTETILFPTMQPAATRATVVSPIMIYTRYQSIHLQLSSWSTFLLEAWKFVSKYLLSNRSSKQAICHSYFRNIGLLPGLFYEITLLVTSLRLFRLPRSFICNYKLIMNSNPGLF